MTRDEPICEYGFTEQEVDAILGDRRADFDRWMRGQTVALCKDHGAVVYRWDLDRYLDGGLIVD